ncbi:MAG: hypothetical protein ACODAU_09355 [Myxococcota bacterium]
MRGVRIGSFAAVLSAFAWMGCGDEGGDEGADGGRDGSPPASMCETEIPVPPGADAGVDAGTGPDAGDAGAGAGDAGADAGGTEGDGGGGRPECTGDGTAPTYEGEVSSLLEEQCTGCHDQPPRFGAMLPFVTYEDTQAASFQEPERQVYEVMADRVRGIGGDRMPPSCQLPEHLVDILVAWADAGAPLCDN